VSSRFDAQRKHAGVHACGGKQRRILSDEGKTIGNIIRKQRASNTATIKGMGDLGWNISMHRVAGVRLFAIVLWRTEYKSPLTRFACARESTVNGCKASKDISFEGQIGAMRLAPVCWCFIPTGSNVASSLIH